MDPQKVKDYYQEIQKVIDKVGYAIQGVFGDGKPVCYTIGLTPLLGAEILTTAPISLDTLYQMLRTNIDDFIKNKQSIPVDVFSGGYLKNGDELRCKLVDVSTNKDVLNFITVRTCNVDKVYQLYFGDINNILPGEDGYDNNFDQELK